MKIAITADPYLPVPPRHYGGIERIVDFLVRELVARGHDITLFAHPDSHVDAELVPYGVSPHVGLSARWKELHQVGTELWRRRNEFDVIHSFGRLAALFPVLGVRGLPKIQSYQREIVSKRNIQVVSMLAGQSLRFTACSAQMFQRPTGITGSWQTIFNGVDLEKYRFVEAVDMDAPLAFLGRIEWCKGVHCAIQIAKSSGRKLVIAGNIENEAEIRAYFEREVEPHIDDDQIRYIGPVDDARKNELLGSSAALLMPILWEEPFGIVMAEAMACGTPVIGFSRGSVPEVVIDNLNGFVCHDVAKAAHAVEKLAQIDRSSVRQDCETRFSHVVIADQYEQLYYDMNDSRQKVAA